MIATLLDDWKGLKKGLKEKATDVPDLPLLQDVCVHMRSDPLSLEQVKVNVRGYEQGLQGWLRRQSDVYRTPINPPEDVGAPLEGEWQVDNVDDRESVHLRQDGQGGWRLVTITECDESKEGAIPCLCEKVELMGTPDVGGRLRYYVYWHAGKDGAVRRLCARFAGFPDDQTDAAARKGSS